MKYDVMRTDTADSLIRRITLYVAENFGNDVATRKTRLFKYYKRLVDSHGHRQTY